MVFIRGCASLCLAPLCLSWTITAGTAFTSHGVSSLKLVLSSKGRKQKQSVLCPPLQMSTKSPVEKVMNIVESTAASVTDYILMQPKRDIPRGFRRVRTQFIAALGDKNANSGSGAQKWGLWTVDPGPRGVFVSQYKQLQKSGVKAPAGWTFDENDWWLEEHGLVMEPPRFPLPAGRYLVTGGRKVTSVLTIGRPDHRTRTQEWKLDSGVKLHDVTHLPCRAARYTPTKGEGSPAMVKQSDFPLAPGAKMPAVTGCNKQDYAVLFVIGLED